MNRFGRSSDKKSIYKLDGYCWDGLQPWACTCKIHWLVRKDDCSLPFRAIVFFFVLSAKPPKSQYHPPGKCVHTQSFLLFTTFLLHYLMASDNIKLRWEEKVLMNFSNSSQQHQLLCSVFQYVASPFMIVVFAVLFLLLHQVLPLCAPLRQVQIQLYIPKALQSSWHAVSI